MHELDGYLPCMVQASEGSSVPVETSLLRSAVDGLRQAGNLAEQLEEVRGSSGSGSVVIRHAENRTFWGQSGGCEGPAGVGVSMAPQL